MKANEITSVVEKLIESQLPVFIWGAPGIGKSSIVKQIAKEKGLVFLDLRLSLLDPTDLKGIPFFDAKTQKGVWAQPSFLPSDEQEEGILFLDEINAAPPAVQASAYQLILDRRVGEYTLPKGWSIVAAGNRETDRGVVYKMPPPLANRFVHLEMEVDFETWKQWAIEQKIENSIVAYLAYAPQMLFNFNPVDNKKAFATPRSWGYVHTIMQASLENDLLLESLRGAVGNEAAIGYVSFLKVMHQLPDFQTILEGSLQSFETNDTKIWIALTMGLLNALLQEPTTTHISHVLHFSLSMPGEFSIMLVKDMQYHTLPIEASEAWDAWVQKFAYLLV